MRTHVLYNIYYFGMCGISLEARVWGVRKNERFRTPQKA